MTNLDIIKYLAYENPRRLAALLEDISGYIWIDGANDKFSSDSSFPNFHKWIYEDASTTHPSLYRDGELEKWNKAIHPTYTITFENGKLECKDGKLSMQSGDCAIVIDQAIDELKLLENVIEATRHDAIDYMRFRKSVCAYCYDPNCMRSQVEICNCHKFRSYY